MALRIGDKIMLEDSEHPPKLLSLFALWDRVEKIDLGGLKYGYEMEKRFKIIKAINLVTQEIGLENEAKVSKLNIYSKSKIKRIFYYLLLYVMIIKSVRIIKKENANAVATFGIGWINDITAIIASLLTKRKLIKVFHHWPYEGYSLGSLFLSMRKEGRGFFASIFASLDRIIALQAVKRAALVYVPSEPIKEDLQRIGIDGKRIKIVPPGVGDEFFNMAPEKGDRNLYDGVAVNRFSKEKGVYDLIDIWAIVTREKTDAKLRIFGHPTEIMDDWTNSVKSEGLKKNISYLGTVDVEELAKTLAGSKVFLFPSHKEGFGIAVAEAMAVGLPIICYDIKPMNEIFNSKGVFFVKEGDHEAFAKMVLLLLKNPILQAEAGRANAEFAKRFRWSEASERFETILIKALS